MTLADGHLDITYDSGAGTAVWRTSRNEQQRLKPYTYEVGLVGTDRNDDAMHLDLEVTPSRAPVPLGASSHNGKITASARTIHTPTFKPA